MFDFAAELDRPDKIEPIEQPAPEPPRAARPLKLSVTAIEDWLRDPYTIYARHILRLQPLDPVDMPLSAADRGSAIHDALGEFTQTYADATCPTIRRGALRRHRRQIFRATDGAAGSARAVVAAIPAHRRAGSPVGRPSGATTSTASPPRSAARFRSRSTTSASSSFGARRPHRAARTTDRYAILDYKTGQPPTGKQVRMGLSPQLTLEAAILREGGFDGIPAGSLGQPNSAMSGSAATIRPASKGRWSSSSSRPIRRNRPTTPRTRRWQQLETLIRKFEDEAQATRRSICRCGRTATATTTISPASRNGRRPAAWGVQEW